MKPNFFMVGAPRCGTTSLYEALRQHPSIFMPDTKEPHFFSKDLQDPVFYMTLEKYLSLFLDVSNAERIGEASTYYLYSKVAASEIKSFCPDAKIMIMLRNPVDMMYSLYAQSYYYWSNIYQGHEDIADFGQALAAEEERKQGRRLPKDTPNNVCVWYHLYYRDLARYTNQVKRYLDTFGQANTRIILFDDMKRDFPRVFRNTCAFLDVEIGFVPEYRRMNGHTQIRSRFVQAALRALPSRYIYSTRLIAGRIFGQRRVQILLQVLRKPVAPPPIDPALRQRLLHEFKPEIDSLSTLIERDLGAWHEV